MMKGILLNRKPWMKYTTLLDIFKDINYLSEQYQELTDKEGYKMILKTFIGNKFKIKIYESKNIGGLDAIYTLFSIMSMSIPEYIRGYRMNNKVIMAYPNFGVFGESQEYTLDLFIEELIRVSIICIKEFGEDNLCQITKFLMDYVDTCVYYNSDKEN